MTPPSLDTALRYLALGFSVIPVPRPRPGTPSGTIGDGKVPAIGWTPYQTRRPTGQEIHTWFGHEPMNLAVITGAISGVVVIDADTVEAMRWCVRALPYTPWQTKTGRGYHLWYQHPGDEVSNSSRDLVTSDGPLKVHRRADRGYVIAPGSIHASGTRYAEAGDWTALRSDVPRFCPEWFPQPPPPATPPISLPRPTGDLVERGRAYLASIPPPEIGGGSNHDTFYAACRLVRGFGLSHADAETLLWEWAGNRPGWTRAWVADRVVHADRYGQEPVGGLR